MSNLLFDERPLVLQPRLAFLLGGSDEAIILQQVHYWTQKNMNIRDGYSWVYNSMKDWHKQFYWISESSVKRIFTKLEKKGVLITGNYNKAKFDKTKWYRIDYGALDEMEQRLGQIDPTNGSKRPNAKGQIDPTYTIDYTETTTENNKIDSVRILSETPNLENLSLENLNLENSTLINTNSNNTNLNKDNRSTDKSIDRVSVKQLEEDFSKLWKLYPRKEGKKKAFESYKRAIKKGTTNKEIQTGIVNYLTQIKVQSTDKKYIKQGSTWFGGECWNDEYNLGQEKSSVNSKTVSSSASAERTVSDLEREERESRRDAFPMQYKNHPEWFTDEDVQNIIEEFPELKEKVLEIERARATSDRNTAK